MLLFELVDISGSKNLQFSQETVVSKLCSIATFQQEDYFSVAIKLTQNSSYKMYGCYIELIFPYSNVNFIKF